MAFGRPGHLPPEAVRPRFEGHNPAVAARVWIFVGLDIVMAFEPGFGDEFGVVFLELWGFGLLYARAVALAFGNKSQNRGFGFFLGNPHILLSM